MYQETSGEADFFSFKPSWLNEFPESDTRNDAFAVLNQLFWHVPIFFDLKVGEFPLWFFLRSPEN